LLMVGVGSDSFGLDLLLDVEQFVDRDDVAAAGAAASLALASGEQVALGAATLAGEPVTAAGTFIDAAGRPRASWGQRREDRRGRVVALAVGGLATTRRTPGAGPSGGHRTMAGRAGWRNVRVTPRELRHRGPPGGRPAPRPAQPGAGWAGRVRRASAARRVVRATSGAGRAGAVARPRSW